MGDLLDGMKYLYQVFTKSGLSSFNFNKNDNKTEIIKYERKRAPEILDDETKGYVGPKR